MRNEKYNTGRTEKGDPEMDITDGKIRTREVTTDPHVWTAWYSFDHRGTHYSSFHDSNISRARARGPVAKQLAKETCRNCAMYLHKCGCEQQA